MSSRRIPVIREGRVVIGYRVTEQRWEFYETERGEWWSSGGGGDRRFDTRHKALAEFHKALKRGSCCASMQAIVIPERLWQ